MTDAYHCPECGTLIKSVEGGPDPRTGGRMSRALPCGHVIDFRTALAANVDVVVRPTNGANLIVAERRRQVEEEGYTPEHDAAHDSADLPWAAWAYLDRAVGAVPADPLTPPQVWPDGWEWKPDKSPTRMLIIAGALIAAELDRRLAGGEKIERERDG